MPQRPHTFAKPATTQNTNHKPQKQKHSSIHIHTLSPHAIPVCHGVWSHACMWEYTTSVAILWFMSRDNRKRRGLAFIHVPYSNTFFFFFFFDIKWPDHHKHEHEEARTQCRIRLDGILRLCPTSQTHNLCPKCGTCTSWVSTVHTYIHGE